MGDLLKEDGMLALVVPLLLRPMVPLRSELPCMNLAAEEAKKRFLANSGPAWGKPAAPPSPPAAISDAETDRLWEAEKARRAAAAGGMPPPSSPPMMPPPGGGGMGGGMGGAPASTPPMHGGDGIDDDIPF